MSSIVKYYTCEHLQFFVAGIRACRIILGVKMTLNDKEYNIYYVISIVLNVSFKLKQKI